MLNRTKVGFGIALFALIVGALLVAEPLDAKEPSHYMTMAAHVGYLPAVGTAPPKQPGRGTEHFQGVGVEFTLTGDFGGLDPRMASDEVNGCTADQIEDGMRSAGMKFFFRCGLSMDFVVSEFYCIQLQEGGFHYMAGGRCT